MEVTSDECLSEVRSLLSCPSKITVARNLQGDEAQFFINFLDQVGGFCSYPDSTAQNTGCRFLHDRLLRQNTGNGVCSCFPRSARLIISYPLHIVSVVKFTSRGFSTAAGSQM